MKFALAFALAGSAAAFAPQASVSLAYRCLDWRSEQRDVNLQFRTHVSFFCATKEHHKLIHQLIIYPLTVFLAPLS